MSGPELVARAEHELRGAATALALACEALRRDPSARGHAAVIDAQLDRLRAGLNDLELARRAPAAPEPEGGQVGPLAEAVEVSALARAASRPWATAFEWEGGPVPASLDRRRFAKALGNVLANAAEHGSGDIRVTGRVRNGGIEVQVRNRGRGLRIASEAAEELGGSLRFEMVEDTAVATLELPVAESSAVDDPADVSANLPAA